MPLAPGHDASIQELADAIAAGKRSAVGSETNGSVVVPAAMNGIVGFKPRVGLVSRAGIIPIAASQDTAGPMTHSVAGALVLLRVMAGSDPRDPATYRGDAARASLAAPLASASLSGVRLEVAHAFEQLTAARRPPVG